MPKDNIRILYVPLTNSDKMATVDAEDYSRVMMHTWHLEKNGYIKMSSNRAGQKNRFLHRFIMNAKPDEHVDHKYGDLLDYRKESLRVCTRSQNLMNQRVQSRKKISQYKGVTKHKSGLWFMQIKKNGKRAAWGYFKQEVDAARAYDEKAKELFGEFARLNNVA